MLIGENIKNIRKSKRISQKDLAEMLGVSRQAICMWETGKRDLRVSTLNKIAKVFNMTTDEIISGGTVGYPKGNMAADTVSVAVNVTEREVGMALRKTATSKSVEFSISAPTAKNVAVTGSFNAWNKSGISMKKEKSGYWKTEISLKPGKYEYKYIVDGNWWTDPTNPHKMRNSFGSENSVKEVTA